jgi:TP901 family phage tail tape measure protein
MAAANFEQRLSAIKAVSGATEGQMGKLSDKALQLGKDTQFSAGESAQAMEELIKAGLSVGDVLNGAADATVNLAAAGEVSMPEAATIASNAMNQFGLSAKDMVGVADQIAGAANASAIDVSDFGQSLAQVGAVANLAGVDFKDTATAIAIMGNAGIKGSDAGTSLKSMLSRLQPTTKKQASLMKELGIVTKDGSNQFYDQAGNLKDLGKVSGVLQNSLKGMTKQQKQAALQTLFGSDAIRAAAVLSDKGAKGFDKMSAAMGKVKAADVAATKMDNFKGSIEQMKGSLETLGITMGSVLLPGLRKVVDALTEVINWVTNLRSGQQKAIVAGLALAAASLHIV